MTELHLKSLSRLTPDVRLAYDGDAAGVKATERAIMMAGDLGVNLSVISDYHGAKDPDELIQKDPRLWQEAVKNYRPAVDWLLDKYEENLDLNSGAGKREYSSIALKLLKYVSDAVERKHYEKLVARKLDCSVEDLHEKDLKMSSSGSAQRLKSVATKDAQVKVDLIRKLNDTLQALIIHGGVENKYGLDVTEDEVKIGELEMVFQNSYAEMGKAALEREADAIFARYKIEMNKQRIRVLTEELEKCADDEEKTQEILREIAALKVK
jgi:DNA primase